MLARARLGCGHLVYSLPILSLFASSAQSNGSRQLSCNQDGSLAGIEVSDKKFASCHHLNMFCSWRERERDVELSSDKINCHSTVVVYKSDNYQAEPEWNYKSKDNSAGRM